MASGGEDLTSNTKTALLSEVHDAQTSIAGVKRSVKRISWAYTTIALLAGVFMAGLGAGEYTHRYVTQVQLSQALADISRLQGRIDAAERRLDVAKAREDANDKMWKRIADEMDDIHKYFRKLH